MTNNVQLFIERLAAWEAVVPKALLGENPRIVLTILQRSAFPGGIFQSQLKQQLGVNQSYLSKLMHKLEDTAHWIEIKSPTDDKRRRVSTTTEAGNEALASLETRLKAVNAGSRSPSRTPRLRPRWKKTADYPQPGQPSFF